MLATRLGLGVLAAFAVFIGLSALGVGLFWALSPRFGPMWAAFSVAGAFAALCGVLVAWMQALRHRRKQTRQAKANSLLELPEFLVGDIIRDRPFITLGVCAVLGYTIAQNPKRSAMLASFAAETLNGMRGRHDK